VIGEGLGVVSARDNTVPPVQHGNVWDSHVLFISLGDALHVCRSALKRRGRDTLEAPRMQCRAQELSQPASEKHHERREIPFQRGNDPNSHRFIIDIISTDFFHPELIPDA
jgi:hypothetical protein